MPDLAAAEDLANDLVDDDLPIRAWFPDAGEASRGLKLRRDPEGRRRYSGGRDRRLRLLAVRWHPRREDLAARHRSGSRTPSATKGMTRVTFAAGRRARARELFTRDQVLRGLATRFSCAPGRCPHVDRQGRARCRSAHRRAHDAALSRLAAAIAAGVHGHGHRDRGAARRRCAALMREVASKLVATGH